jgi:uncharacterized protein
MITLSAIEMRVLGTMIEKAQTVPGQYPITLNALTTGCNQKNARDPVSQHTEEEVFEGLEGLRNKGLVREAQLSGSRVPKYRHVARETWGMGTDELVILAELFLRGPQSLAEVRANASRMSQVSPERMTEIVARLSGPVMPPDALGEAAPTVFIKELARRPGERATRWTQLLCPVSQASGGGARSGGDADDAVDSRAGDVGGLAEFTDATRSSRGEIEARIHLLENQLIELKSSVDRLANAVDRLQS